MNQGLGETGTVVMPAARRYALVATLVALALVCLIAASFTQGAFVPRGLSATYLTALVFATGLSLGALGWLMLHHVTGAVWSVVLRRLMENVAWPLPWLALGFLPLVLDPARLYPWAEVSRLATEPALARKAVWLNPLFFGGRTLLYLGVWSLLAMLLFRRSARQDRDHDAGHVQAMRTTSSWGLVVLAGTASLASFDWLMSLDPSWSSTIFGVYFWANSLVGSLAALVLTVLLVRGLAGLHKLITIEHLHDLGKLLFGFVIFWAYIAFSQYFLIWYANFPEETHWYVARRTGGWNTVSWLLFFGHFVSPFALLLFHGPKRNPFLLGFAAAWVLVFHYVDCAWLIMPSVGVPAIGLRDLTAGLASFFLWGAMVAAGFRARPLVAVGDLLLEESRTHHGA